MSQFYNDAIFWVDADKITPNPYQPRKDFDEAKLRELADSIRQYGMLQPLVVTRHEKAKEDGGIITSYELIAGERRLRAAKLLGLPQVPVMIRVEAQSDRMKLELAIIENLQREDLNAVDRARAFDRLVKEFGFKHNQIAAKVGKSREYVSNTLRLLMLPVEMIDALSAGAISEGHTRPLLMVSDYPDEQKTFFKEIVLKKMSVREAEQWARKIAQDRVRKKEYIVDPETAALEKELTETLGTRVSIEHKDYGGRIHIDYFSTEDLRALVGNLKPGVSALSADASPAPLDDRSKEEKEAEELYSIKNFSI